MGIVKTYNVLGGSYGYYNTTLPPKSVHRPSKIYKIFLSILHGTFLRPLRKAKILHKFVILSSRSFAVRVFSLQTKPQILLC